MAEGVSEKIRLALVGDVELGLMEPYFREEGFEVYTTKGFATWRQELLDKDSPLNRFEPDIVFDVTEFDDILSKEVDGFWDERMKTLAAMPYSLAGIRAIIEEFEYRLKLAGASPKKVLAVDADGTLWRGAIGEDGPEGVEEIRAFQSGLKSLAERGVALVLLSKNDEAENFLPGFMTLCDEDFAVRKINWRAKAANLEEACRELGLDLSSVVFLDDNPGEQAEMIAAHGEVAIAPWRGWPDGDSAEREAARLLRRLESYAFPAAGRTREDVLRNKDYSSRALRKKLLARFSSADEYLAALQLEVTPGLAAKEDLPRLAQMAQRTNRFNSTSIRRDEASFAALIADPGKKVFTFRSRDRFGDQGLVLYIVVDLAARRITDFAMSCRVMSRTLEYFALDYVEKAIGFALEIDFVKSPKNDAFEEFLSSPRRENSFYSSVYGPAVANLV